MNSSMIRYILGHILRISSALLMLPVLTALIYQESEGLWYLGVAIFCLALGYVLTLRKPFDNVFYLKEGCIITSLSWVLLAVFGALPFVLTGEIPSFTGISAPYEAPEHPELILDTETLSEEACVSMLFDAIENAVSGSEKNL